jgi:putative addiction module killer protein
VQIDRLKSGNPSQGHGVGKVQEIKIDFGPGYRVYYSIVESGEVILLLVAGDKSTQQEDIRTAEGYLADYGKRVKEKSK